MAFLRLDTMTDHLMFDAAEHIDPSRSFMNVYWDMYQGYNIAGADGVRPERRFSFERN